jgi:hypothetical protein
MDNRFQDMRDKMNRDREAFFGTDSPQPFFGRESPFFRQSRPGSGFEDFPGPQRTNSASPSANLMGFPDKMESSRKSSAPPAAPSSDSNSNQAESVPIRVLHEKHKYAPGGHSRTADLPASAGPAGASQRGPPEQHGSPRVTRAFSEPPKNFSARILKTKIPLGNVSEQSEHNLSTSASEPSVPHSKSPSRGTSVSGTEAAPTSGPQKSRENTTEPTVRHIPIMVEGREEPLNIGAATARSESAKKPSDFYPSNVNKMERPRDQPPKPPTSLKVNNLKNVQNQEPTSPLSPIPSDQPIPMGYHLESVDNNVAAAVPVSVSGAAKIQSGEGENNQDQKSRENTIDKKEKKKLSSEQEPVSFIPIPMPCAPEHLQQQNQNHQQGKPSHQPEQQPGPAPGPTLAAAAPIPVTVKIKMNQDDPCFSKLNKIMENVLDLEKQLSAFQGEKNSKEYKFLDEMLTRNLLALDEIETAGRDDVRQQRKESIKSINRCLSILESKAKTNQAEKNNAILSDLAQHK